MDVIKLCEVCGKEHDGTYGSGRFCSYSCKQKYSSKKGSVARAKATKEKLGIKCKCEFCGEEFQSKLDLRKHLPKCEKKHSREWKCNVCGNTFPSRRALFAHKKEFSHSKRGSNQRGEFYCKFCNKFSPTKSGASQHERCCIKNPNRVHGASFGKRHTETERKEISERMKKLHSEGKAFSWADLSKRKEPSYPEKWLMKVLKNEFGLVENKDYKREVKFYTFSLDFVFDNKYVIEVDGSQHKRSAYQQDCDRRKDNKLKQEGWKELRLDWDFCYQNSKDAIHEIAKFLGLGAREVDVACLLNK